MPDFRNIADAFLDNYGCRSFGGTSAFQGGGTETSHTVGKSIKKFDTPANDDDSIEAAAEEQAIFEDEYNDFLHTHFNYTVGPSWAIPTPYWQISFEDQPHSQNDYFKSYNTYAQVGTRDDSLLSDSDKECKDALSYPADCLEESESNQAKCRFKQKEQSEDEIDTFCGDRENKGGPCDGAPDSEVGAREIACDGCSAYPEIEYWAVDQGQDGKDVIVTRYTKNPMESSLCDLGTTGVMSLKFLKTENDCPPECPPEPPEEEEEGSEAEGEDGGEDEIEEIAEDVTCEGPDDCPEGKVCAFGYCVSPGVPTLFSDGSASSSSTSGSDTTTPEDEDCEDKETVDECNKRKNDDSAAMGEMCWCSDYICSGNCTGGDYGPGGYYEYGPGGNGGYGTDPVPRCYDACAFYRFNKPDYLKNSIVSTSSLLTKTPGPLSESSFIDCVDLTSALTEDQKQEIKDLMEADDTLTEGDAEDQVRANAATSSNAIIVSSYQYQTFQDVLLPPVGTKTNSLNGEMSVHVGEQWFWHTGNHAATKPGSGKCFSVEGEKESGGDDKFVADLCVHPQKSPTTNEIEDKSTVKDFHGIYKEVPHDNPDLQKHKIVIDNPDGPGLKIVTAPRYKQTETLKKILGFDNPPEAGTDVDYYMEWDGKAMGPQAQWQIWERKANPNTVVAWTTKGHPGFQGEGINHGCGNGTPVSESPQKTCWRETGAANVANKVFVMHGDCDAIPGGGFIEGIHVSFLVNIADNVILLESGDYEQGTAPITDYFESHREFPIQGVVTKGSLQNSGREGLTYSDEWPEGGFDGEWGIFWRPCVDSDEAAPNTDLTSDGFGSSENEISEYSLGAQQNMFRGDLVLQQFDESTASKASTEYASTIPDISNGACISFDIVKTKIQEGFYSYAVAEGIITKGSAIYSSGEISSFDGEWGIFNISQTNTDESKILFAVNTTYGVFTEFINIGSKKNYRIQFSISPNFASDGTAYDGGTCSIKLVELTTNIPVSERQEFSHSSKYGNEITKEITYIGNIVSSNSKILMGLNGSTDNSILGSAGEVFQIKSVNVHEGPTDSDIYSTTITGRRTIKDTGNSRSEHNTLSQKTSLTDLESFNKQILDNVHGAEESKFFDSSFSPSSSTGTGISACFELLAQTADFVHYEKLVNKNNYYDTIVSKGVYTPVSGRELSFSQNFVTKDDPRYDDFDIEWGVFFNAREPFYSIDGTDGNRKLNIFFAVKTEEALYYERAHISFDSLYACCFGVNPSTNTFGLRLMNAHQCYEGSGGGKTCPVQMYPSQTTRPEFEDGAPYTGGLKPTSEPMQIIPNLGDHTHWSNKFARWSIRNISFSKTPKCLCDIKSFSMSTTTTDGEIFYPEPTSFNATYKNGICITAKIKRVVDVSCMTVGGIGNEPVNLISKGVVSQHGTTPKVLVDGEYSLFSKAVCNNKTQNLFFAVNSSKGIVSIPIGSDGKIISGHWHDIMLNISPKDPVTGKVTVTTKYIRDRYGDKKTLSSNFVSENTRELSSDFEFPEDTGHTFKVGNGFLDGEKYLISDVSVFESCDTAYGGFGATDESLSFDDGDVGKDAIKIEATAPTTKKQISPRLSYNFTRFGVSEDRLIFPDTTGSNLALYDQTNRYSGVANYFAGGMEFKSGQGLDLRPGSTPSNANIGTDTRVNISCFCSGDKNEGLNGSYKFIGTIDNLVVGDGKTDNVAFHKDYYKYTPSNYNENWFDGAGKPVKGYINAPVFYKGSDDGSYILTLTGVGENMGQPRKLANGDDNGRFVAPLDTTEAGLKWQIIKWKSDEQPKPPKVTGEDDGSIYDSQNYGDVLAISDTREGDAKVSLSGKAQFADYSFKDAAGARVQKDGALAEWTILDEDIEFLCNEENLQKQVIWITEGRPTEGVECQGNTSVPQEDCNCNPSYTGGTGNDAVNDDRGADTVTLSGWGGLDAYYECTEPKLSCLEGIDGDALNGEWKRASGDDRIVDGGKSSANPSGNPIHGQRCQFMRELGENAAGKKITAYLASGSCAVGAGGPSAGMCDNMTGVNECWYIVLRGCVETNGSSPSITFLAEYGAVSDNNPVCPNFDDICKECLKDNGGPYSGTVAVDTEEEMRKCFEDKEHWGGAWNYMLKIQSSGGCTTHVSSFGANYPRWECSCDGGEETGCETTCDESTPCPDGQECNEGCCEETEEPPTPDPMGFTDCKEGRLLFCVHGYDKPVYTYKIASAAVGETNKSPWRRISMQIRNTEEVNSSNEAASTRPGQLLISHDILKSDGTIDLTDVDEIKPDFSMEIPYFIKKREDVDLYVGYNKADDELWGQDGEGADITEGDEPFDPTGGQIAINVQVNGQDVLTMTDDYNPVNVCRDDDEDGAATGQPTSFPNALGWMSNVVFLDDIRISKELCEMGSGSQELGFDGFKKKIGDEPYAIGLDHDPCNEEPTETSEGVPYDQSPLQQNIELPVNPCYIPILPRCGDTLYLRQRDPDGEAGRTGCGTPRNINCRWEFARSLDCLGEDCNPSKSEQDDGLYRARLSKGEVMAMSDNEIMDIFNGMSPEQQQDVQDGGAVDDNGNPLSTMQDLIDWVNRQFPDAVGDFFEQLVSVDGVGGNASDSGSLISDVVADNPDTDVDEGSNNTDIQHWFDYVEDSPGDHDELFGEPDGDAGPLHELEDIKTPTDIIAHFIATRTCYNIPASDIEDKHRKCISPTNLQGTNVGFNNCIPKVECCVPCCDKEKGGNLDYLIEGSADCFPASVTCDINDALNADNIMTTDCKESDECKDKGPYGPEHFEAQVVFMNDMLWYVTVYRSWLWEELYSDEAFQAAIQRGDLVTSYGKRLLNGTRCAPIDEDGHALECMELIAERHVYFEAMMLNPHLLSTMNGTDDDGAMHELDEKTELWIDNLTAELTTLGCGLDTMFSGNGGTAIQGGPPEAAGTFNCGKCPELENSSAGDNCNCTDGDSSTSPSSGGADCGGQDEGSAMQQCLAGVSGIHCYSRKKDNTPYTIKTKRVSCGGKVQLAFCRGACDYWWNKSNSHDGNLANSGESDSNPFGTNVMNREMDPPYYSSSVETIESSSGDESSVHYPVYGSDAVVQQEGGFTGAPNLHQTWMRMGDYHSYTSESEWKMSDYLYAYSSIEIPSTEEYNPETDYIPRGSALGFANSNDHYWDTVSHQIEVQEFTEDVASILRQTLLDRISEDNLDGWDEDIDKHMQEMEDEQEGNFKFLEYTYQDWPPAEGCPDGYEYDEESGLCAKINEPDDTITPYSAIRSGFKYEKSVVIAPSYAPWHPWMWGRGYLRIEDEDLGAIDTENVRALQDPYVDSSSRDIVESIQNAGIEWYKNSPINWREVNVGGVQGSLENRASVSTRGVWLNGALGSPACCYDPCWFGTTGGLLSERLLSGLFLNKKPSQMLSEGIYGEHRTDRTGDGALESDHLKPLFGFTEPEDGDTPYYDEFEGFTGSRKAFPVISDPRRFGNLFSYYPVLADFSKCINPNIGKDMYPFNLDFNKPFAGIPIFDSLREEDSREMSSNLYAEQLSRVEAFVLEDSSFMAAAAKGTGGGGFTSGWLLSAGTMWDYGLRHDLSSTVYQSPFGQQGGGPGRENMMYSNYLHAYKSGDWLPSSRYGPVSFTIDTGLSGEDEPEEEEELFDEG